MVEESSGGEERLLGEPASADGWTGCLSNDCFHTASHHSRFGCSDLFTVVRL